MIKKAITQARAEAAALQQSLERGPGARELALAETKLEEAEMWLERSAAISERVESFTQSG